MEFFFGILCKMSYMFDDANKLLAKFFKSIYIVIYAHIAYHQCLQDYLAVNGRTLGCVVQ